MDTNNSRSDRHSDQHRWAKKKNSEQTGSHPIYQDVDSAELLKMGSELTVGAIIETFLIVWALDGFVD